MNGTNHTPSVPHLLIPDSILNGPIQVSLIPVPVLLRVSLIPVPDPAPECAPITSAAVVTLLCSKFEGSF